MVVPLDRCAVLVPAGGGPEEVHLGGKELAMEDVSLRQPGDLFDVKRRRLSDRVMIVP